jgi:hypothetical protein
LGYKRSTRLLSLCRPCPCTVLGTTSQHSTGQSRFPEHNGLPRRGLLGGTSGRGPPMGGLVRSGVRGGGGWVTDPPGHATPDYALENEPPVGRGAGGCQVVPTGTRSPAACTALWCPDRPPSSGLGRGCARPPPTPVAASLINQRSSRSQLTARTTSGG